MTTRVKVGELASFPEREATAVTVEGRNVVVIRLGQRIYALDNACTHATAQLSGGEVEEGEIACPLHGARFHLESGAAMTPPAVRPVKTYEVEVTDGVVFIQL